MNFHFVFILTLALKMVAANPRQFQGFTYLGSAHKSENPSIMAYYYLSTFAATWIDAYSLCGSIEGMLVSPVNPIEDYALRNVMIASGRGTLIWTGARYSRDREWIWEPKNIKLLYKNFHSAACESNSGCAGAYANGATWGWCGENCNTYRYFVCEF